MIDRYSSGPMAIPRAGVARMSVDADGRLSREELIAGWTTPEVGDGSNGNRTAPKRVVIRVDGYVSNQSDINGDVGFPCAIVQVIYRVGGFTREVLVDAVNQSALVVWAESVEVKSVWDLRRIARLAAISNGESPSPIFPCISQDIACAISACDCGDTGAADARWLDMLSPIAGESDEISLHVVPNGARGVRFLNGIASGAIVRMANTATFINFYASKAPEANAFVETANNNVTDQAIINVPTTAQLLAITFPSGTLESLDSPSWIEWVMSPATGAYY